MRCLIIFLFTVLLLSCSSPKNDVEVHAQSKSDIELIVLGTAQDAGYPQIACQKSCCKDLNDNDLKGGKVVSLGLINHSTQKTYMFEATPDFVSQTAALTNKAESNKHLPDCIFITHAHIGHYTGLMFLGKEAVDAKDIPVYSLPRFTEFLQTNGPWDQLVKRKNIIPSPLMIDSSLQLDSEISILTKSVPHRDEYSETAAYIIQGPNRSALFIPDIDKWEKWETDINKLIQEVDYAFLDATFYDGVEINNRDISQIPHPFIIESLERFDTLSEGDKKKIYFIHFNHTNPVWKKTSNAYKNVISNGFNVAEEGMVFEL